MKHKGILGLDVQVLSPRISCFIYGHIKKKKYFCSQTFWMTDPTWQVSEGKWPYLPCSLTSEPSLRTRHDIVTATPSAPASPVLAVVLFPLKVSCHFGGREASISRHVTSCPSNLLLQNC